MTKWQKTHESRNAEWIKQTEAELVLAEQARTVAMESASRASSASAASKLALDNQQEVNDSELVELRSSASSAKIAYEVSIVSLEKARVASESARLRTLEFSSEASRQELLIK